MPQFDWWEERFQIDHRPSKLAKRQTRRKPDPTAEPRSHTRDRPHDPVGILKANARHFEEPPVLGSHGRLLRCEQKTLRPLAYYCSDRSALLNGVVIRRYADALIALSAHWRDWLRPLDAWQPPPGNTATQFGSLLRHLLARFDLPAFLDSAWLFGLTADGAQQQRWFKRIASGQSIRTAEGLPFPLTKRMAHHFLQAPSDFDIPAALRYGQVLGLGGTETLARSLLGTRLRTDFSHNDFWETVVRWLIDHPELEVVHHGPIIDYIHDQKFVPSLPSGLGRGHPRLVPPRPHLCMRGRRPGSLLRTMEQWHRRMWGRQMPFATWRPSGIQPFTRAEDGARGRKVYALTELISSGELQEEGEAMGHCVASYCSRCVSGEASIWSLTVEKGIDEVERLLTVEVANGSQVIIQARGKFNRVAAPEELGILKLWTQAGGPKRALGFL
jgi:hypothetical protein